MQRTAVFKWIGAIILDLGREGLPPLAYQLLAPLARELVSTDESDSGKQLHQLASQVSELVKKKLGMEVYTRHLSRLQINLATRRADRKKLRAQEVSEYRFCRMEGA
jgi:U3 small nucleolar RNA-associated protein 20